MNENRDPEIRRIAAELLRHRGFPTDVKLPEWSLRWPELVLDGWGWGDGDEGRSLLELHVTIGGCSVSVEGDGGVWWRGPDGETLPTLEPFDAYDQFPTLGADEAMKLENALDVLHERFEDAIKQVTHELLVAVRDLAVSWLAGGLRK